MSAFKNTILCMLLLMAYSANKYTASPKTVAEGINVAGSHKITFNNGMVKMAANLYLPPNYNAAKKYPAIVVSHPWGGVKEQTSGLYAQQLARKGFITLAYDASHYGESGGIPRDLEDPSDRVQDI